MALPDGMTPAQGSILAVAALNGGAAQQAKGQRIHDSSAYGRAIVSRGIDAWKQGEWGEWEAAVLLDMERLEGRTWQFGEPDIEHVMGLLLCGGPVEPALVQAWTRVVLGHALGRHHTQECQPCRCAEEYEGSMLIRACDRNERTLRNLYDSLVFSGYVKALPPAPPKPTPAELAFQTSRRVRTSIADDF